MRDACAGRVLRLRPERPARATLGASRRATTGASIAGAFAAFGLIVWGARMRRARRSFTPWSRETRARFDALGLPARPDPLRAVLPSRNDALGSSCRSTRRGSAGDVKPSSCASRDAIKVKEHDVHHAVDVCQRLGARVAFLLHDDPASLDLGAVRAVLDWAGRGGTRAVHVLPLAVSRLEWARTAERSARSRRGDLAARQPLRGSRAHHVVEPVLEPRAARLGPPRRDARRALGRRDGPPAFRQVVARARGRAQAPGALGLRGPRGLPPRDRVRQGPFARGRRHPALGLRSAHRLGARPLPPGEGPGGARRRGRRGGADARGARPLLGLRALRRRAVRRRCSSCSTSSSRCSRWTSSRAGQALDVLAILLGRLRNALGREPSPSGAASVGVLLCGALHPLLWAPLRTLGQQSIMGAFPVALRAVPLAGGGLVDDAWPRRTPGHPLCGRSARFHRRAIARRAAAPAAHRDVGARALRSGSRAPGQPRRGQRGDRGSARGRRPRRARRVAAARVGRVRDRRARRTRGGHAAGAGRGRSPLAAATLARSPSAASSRSSRRAASRRAWRAKRSSDARRRPAACCSGSSERPGFSSRSAIPSRPRPTSWPTAPSEGCSRGPTASATRRRPRRPPPPRRSARTARTRSAGAGPPPRRRNVRSLARAPALVAHRDERPGEDPLEEKDAVDRVEKPVREPEASLDAQVVRRREERSERQRDRPLAGGCARPRRRRTGARPGPRRRERGAGSRRRTRPPASRGSSSGTA